MSACTEPPALPRDISVLVFVNRAAGRHSAASHLPRLQTLFESRGVLVQFVETRDAAELESAARKQWIKTIPFFWRWAAMEPFRPS